MKVKVFEKDGFEPFTVSLYNKYNEIAIESNEASYLGLDIETTKELIHYLSDCLNELGETIEINNEL